MGRSIRVAATPRGAARAAYIEWGQRPASEQVGGPMPLAYERAKSMSNAQVAAIITGTVASALAAVALPLL